MKWANTNAQMGKVQKRIAASPEAIKRSEKKTAAYDKPSCTTTSAGTHRHSCRIDPGKPFLSARGARTEVAMSIRTPAKRKGGRSSSPTLMAIHVEPHKRQQRM